MISLLVLGLLSIPALLAAGYLFLLTAMSRRAPPPPASPARLRFDVVVPAHDEAGGIQRTVRSLRSLAWPADRFRVLVVADNCQDRTAELAAEAGATVLVRRDEVLRGKGYALELAFERSLADGFADAIVVVDADTVASPNLLAALAARLEGGARAVQARYGVLNPDASWRTRLMTLAYAMVNDLRALAHDRLGASCGLHGNGMCFSSDVLRRVPYRAFSIVEDLEYGIDLAEAGIRSRYAHEASVLGEMPSGEAASRSQRRRWEGGRRALARARAVPLLVRGLERRDPVLIHLGIDLLVPPLTRLAAYVAAGTGACAALVLAHRLPLVSLAPWLVSGAFIGAYVTRGALISPLGTRGLIALAWAPAYVLWKLSLLARRGSRKPTEWVRTAREG